MSEPVHIDDPADIVCGITGYAVEVGPSKDRAMHLSPAAARWLAKELQIQAAEVDRKTARAMVGNVRKVIAR